MYKRLKPSCKTVFKIVISTIGDTELNAIIEALGIEPGISENFLFYGFQKKDTTEEKYFLFEQVNDTLSLMLDKKDILIKLKEMFGISYVLEIMFSDIEEEVKRRTSMEIGSAKKFMDDIGGFINLNNGYFDE